MHEPFLKRYQALNIKSNSDAHFGNEITGMTRQNPIASANYFPCRLLHKMDVNVEISSRTVNSQIYQIKAWFSYVGKIPDDRGFCCFPTVPDFADFS